MKDRQTVIIRTSIIGILFNIGLAGIKAFKVKNCFFYK